DGRSGSMPNSVATGASTADAPASTMIERAPSRSPARASAAAPADRTVSGPLPAPASSDTSASATSFAGPDEAASYTGGIAPRQADGAERAVGAVAVGYPRGDEARRRRRAQRGRGGARRRPAGARVPGDAAPLLGRLPQAVERDGDDRRRGRPRGRGDRHRPRELQRADAGREPDAADHGARRVLHALPARGRGGRRDGVRAAGRALRAALKPGSRSRCIA